MEESGLNKKTVLIVDDDPSVGLLVSVILKNLNYNVISFLKGKDLLDYLSKDPSPNLILLDLKLPDIDGYEICKKIRENPLTASIPIIVITGVEELDSKIKLIEIGADDYINKPFDVRELKVRINRIIKRKENDSSLNPITKLPGAPLIEDYTRKKIEKNEYFSYSYIDIDNFKAFNDAYGYPKGDEIIKFTAKIITDSVKNTIKNEYFIGHIGGDDFVIITPLDQTIPTIEEIIKKFDSEIPFFYCEKDRRNGYITVIDRLNNLKQFPIMTLSIAIVDVKKKIHYAKLIEKIFEIKRYLKSRLNKNTSIYHRDRRLND
ncbi:MAG: response regulator [Elusimicrobiales bacterium]|nr:response regulator [Elusimicrobiales bacterium]